MKNGDKHEGTRSATKISVAVDDGSIFAERSRSGARVRYSIGGHEEMGAAMLSAAVTATVNAEYLSPGHGRVRSLKCIQNTGTRWEFFDTHFLENFANRFSPSDSLYRFISDSMCIYSSGGYTWCSREGGAKIKPTLTHPITLLYVYK